MGNGDGKVVAAEYLEFLKGALGSQATLAQAEKSMAFKDKDHDGTLSQAEVDESVKEVDAATIESWCEKLEAKRSAESPAPKAESPASGLFSWCACRPQVSTEEVTSG